MFWSVLCGMVAEEYTLGQKRRKALWGKWMYRTLLTLVSLFLVAAIHVSAAEPSIAASDLRLALAKYLATPGNSTAKGFTNLIRCDRRHSVGGEPYEFEEFLETNWEQLVRTLSGGQGHGIRVALALQCVYLDHHLLNDLALRLDEQAKANPRQFLKEAEALAISEEILVDAVTCSGICGEEEDYIQQWKARREAFAACCRKHQSRYCKAILDGLDSAILEDEKARRESADH